MSNTKTFASLYLGPLEYYFQLSKIKTAEIDIYENFVKQTYRNRCCILSPNGVQNLSIPLIKSRKRKLTKNIKISYDENWQKMHWKSLEAAYRSSPYFEYYEDQFYPYYHDKKFDYLIDFNKELNTLIASVLNLPIEISYSTCYNENVSKENDFRTHFKPNITSNLSFNEYIQVFGDRNGFTPNLSIVDLIFNEGPNALNYLKQLK